MSTETTNGKAPESGPTAEAQQKKDRLSWFTAALILIWAGGVLLLRNAGQTFGLDVEYAGSIVFIGAGVLLWLEALLRLAMPDYRRGIGERVILGMVLLVIGLGQMTEVNLWPLLFVGIGVALLIGLAVAPRAR
jgi:hypothetical protein